MRQGVLDAGAKRASLIPGEKLVLERSFRDMCAQNACGFFGKCYMCPPDVGDVDLLMARLRSFDRVLLFQTVSQIEDSYDIEGMAEAAKHHNRVAVRIRQSVVPETDHLLLSAGGCHLCEPCGKREGVPCRFPGLALASLEAYGVDVYRTAQNAGLPYINGQNTVTYFGALFFMEGHYAVSDD